MAGVNSAEHGEDVHEGDEATPDRKLHHPSHDHIEDGGWSAIHVFACRGLTI